MKANIVVLPGDGIGSEVCTEAWRVLEVIASIHGHHFAKQEMEIGGAAIEKFGIPLPEETLKTCLEADAILLGAVGDPRWNDPSLSVRPEQGLLALRQQLGAFCNLRPITIFPSLINASPVKSDRLVDVDFMIVRELTGGLYFGKPRFREQHEDGQKAVDTLIYTENEIRRISKLAFNFAGRRKKKVTSIDKANVLESSRLWRQIVTETASNYPGIQIDHMLVDSAAMKIIINPAHFDVILTENMFGDILSDEASVLSGSLGLLPSASIGNKVGLYEPVHGSAPDIAGQGIANPIGAILSTALLLRYSLYLEKEAIAIENAVNKSLETGILPADLGGTASTREITNNIIKYLQGE